MALNIDQLVKMYQNGIDSLIDGVGKTVTIFYKSNISNVPDDMNDELRESALRKPVYKDSPQPIIEDNTEDITALVKYNPKDFNKFGMVVANAKEIMRLKTYLTDTPKILRAEYVMVKESQNFIYTKFRLLREPIPIGLGTDRYAISYWERI